MGRIVLAMALLALVSTGCGEADDNNGSKPLRGATADAVPTILILDGSGSMAEADAPGPRIDAAKAAGAALVDALPDGSSIGLITYGTHTGSSDAEKTAGCRDISTLVPLGKLDRGSIRGAINGLRPSGWTPISLALSDAVTQLPDDGKAQAIVLVSDGEDTCDTPPCDAAAEAERSRPGLSISTIGFKTVGAASDQLSCIAAATGGLFVQADNAGQLSARLLATQDLPEAQRSLTNNGLQGITLGSTLDEIRANHRDFPDVSRTGTVTVSYIDCGWTFIDGVLDRIVPDGGGRTIDGLIPGTDLDHAVELYGKPLQTNDNSDGTRTVLFDADPSGEAAYQMVVEEYADSGSTLSGEIQSIVLCRCKPTNPPLADFQGYGPMKIGMTETEVRSVAEKPLDKQHYYNCTVLAAARGADWRELSVWIDDKTGKVTGINTPLGTMTDRGVGDGSTVAAVTEAYAADASVERATGGQGSKILRVTPKDAGYSIAFTLADDDTIGQPHIGRSQGSEGCALEQASSTSTEGWQSCGLYRTDQGEFELVVQPADRCAEAREVFDRMFAGDGVPVARNAVVIDAYTCVGNPAGAASETGVLSYCEYHQARFELRYR
ncbi:VWA domain-containing protein [Skermania piniformis]